MSKNSETLHPILRSATVTLLISPRHTNTIFVGKCSTAWRHSDSGRVQNNRTEVTEVTSCFFWSPVTPVLDWSQTALHPEELCLHYFDLFCLSSRVFALVSVLYPYGWVAVSCCPYVWVDSLVGTEHHRKPMVAGPVHIIDITVQGATKDSEQAAWCRGGLVTPLGSPHSLYEKHSCQRKGCSWLVNGECSWCSWLGMTWVVDGSWWSISACSTDRFIGCFSASRQHLNMPYR